MASLATNYGATSARPELTRRRPKQRRRLAGLELQAAAGLTETTRRKPAFVRIQQSDREALGSPESTAPASGAAPEFGRRRKGCYKARGGELSGAFGSWELG